MKSNSQLMNVAYLAATAVLWIMFHGIVYKELVG